jgi:hypothetical protein
MRDADDGRPHAAGGGEGPGGGGDQGLPYDTMFNNKKNNVAKVSKGYRGWKLEARRRPRKGRKSGEGDAG